MDSDCYHKIKRRLLLGRKPMTNLDSILKSRDITLLTKVHLAKAVVFPVVIYGCESWALKKTEHWRTDAFKLWCLRSLFESPSDCKEIKPVDPKGNQPWILIGRTDAAVPILWPTDVKSQLIGKDPDAGKDWGQEQKQATEYEMIGWHHWLSGNESEQTPGDSEGQGSLVHCSPWGCKELGRTEQLNDWTTATIIRKELEWSHLKRSLMWRK